MTVQLGVVDPSASATGSAAVRMGLTSTVSYVRGPIECNRRSDEISDR